MEIEAQKQLSSESVNWLNSGRSFLLEGLLAAHLGQSCDLLEIGAGAGQNLATLARHGAVDAIETSPQFCQALRANPALRQLFQGSIPELALERDYDAICALDVLEHIEDERRGMAWVMDHLRPGGLFVATVPAYQWMFSDHDRVNQHFRRYTRGRLLERMPPELDIVASGYFNTTLFPLAVASRVLWQLSKGLKPGRPAGHGTKQSSSVPPAVNRLFRAILSAEASAASRGISLPFGLSAYCAARRHP